MDERTDTLAQRLKLARTKRGLKQTELAGLANVTQSDLSKLERGKALTTSSIARLARALRVPAAWLEENEGPMPDWDAPSLVAPAPVSLSEAELVDNLRPEWRELILAYEELLQEDREALIRPILNKAADMRRYFKAGLAKLGIQHKPLGSTGNHLPVAPPYLGPERRQPAANSTHLPERRTSGTPMVPSQMTHRSRNDDEEGKQERGA